MKRAEYWEKRFRQIIEDEYEVRYSKVSLIFELAT